MNACAAPTNATARRLSARGEQQIEESDQLLVVELRAVFLKTCMHNGRQNVIARCLALLRDQRQAVVANPVQEFPRDNGVGISGNALFDPATQLRTIALGYAQHRADGLQRQLACYRLDKLELLLVRHRIEQRNHPLIGLRLECVHGLGREPFIHQCAQPAVLWIVRHIEHDAGGTFVLEGSAACLSIAPFVGGERQRVALNCGHVLVAAHHPESLVVGRELGGGVPIDRRFCPQHRKELVRKSIVEIAPVGEIQMGVDPGHEADSRPATSIAALSSSTFSVAEN
ncbi:MAG: hypothetical protein HC809_11990 [Gammaproteobacteria bacterium]|nr:hypothetical protein [Gammaproteobacteria bacterium]